VSLPALLAGSVAGLELLHPAAIVVLGGMISAALVNLVVVPAFVGLLGPRPTSHTTLDLAVLETEVERDAEIRQTVVVATADGAGMGG
jgi:uncharacterized membrane protein YdfJ with MMPL/SSD domain